MADEPGIGGYAPISADVVAGETTGGAVAGARRASRSATARGARLRAARMGGDALAPDDVLQLKRTKSPRSATIATKSWRKDRAFQSHDRERF